MVNLSRFFINRPVFALVISLFILLLGGLSIPILPVESMPNITPPTIKVSTSYPGAGAPVLEETVAQPIEEQINGVENMIYMSSKSTAAGRYNLTVTFEIGADPDMANVLTQNRVAIAEPRLPEEVKRQGVTVKKQSTNMVMAVTLVSPDGRYDELFLSNYVATQIKDVLARVNGVGEVQVFGAKDFGMRLWLDPDLMTARDLTTSDVIGALREQNVQVAAGKLGQQPTEAPLSFEYSVSTLGRLSEVEQFEQIVVKREAGGRMVRLHEIARVELGSQSYDWYAQLNGAPAIVAGVYQLPGSNALGVAEGVRSAMDELALRFPEGLEYTIPYDATLYIDQSVKSVVQSLIAAVILVILTVFVFLQDFRTTLIPAITIPVSLVGTFAVMLATGYSINNLTLFGLILAIGIVVDDAIVVVEATKRIMDSEGLPAKEAVSKAMGEVAGAVVASTLVLLAVFVPTAVMPGLTGLLYRPFAVTISIATIFSSVNALTLSPALCGILLRPTPMRKNRLFRAFDWVLAKSTNGYMGVVKRLVRVAAVSMLLYAAFVTAMVWGFTRIPTGFVPGEDQGFFFVNAQLPNAASLDRTENVMDQVNEVLMAREGVADVLTIGGYSLLEGIQGSNYGFSIACLEPWSERPTRELTVWGLMQQASGSLARVREAIVFPFSPPPISGLGSAGGFQMELQDRAGAGLNLLEQIANDIVAGAAESPIIGRASQNFRASVPQYFLDIDREKAKKMNVPLDNVFQTLQTNLGSAYVNDFNLFGRTWRVLAQADSRFRARPDDILKLQVRSADGRTVPLGTLVTVEETVGPELINRFNGYPTATITGSPAPGYTEGQSIDEIERIAQARSPDMIGYAWSGVTYQQKQAGNLTPILFTLAIVFVFLFLAAQYESWGTPFAVLFNVPIAILGAVAMTTVMGLENNIYFQIGLVLLIGLSCKTAILLVEFSKQLREEQNMSVSEAALMAAELRFRPILMTAFSFVLGVIPLVIASGAGAVSQRALGAAVFGGMLVATVAGVFFIPLLDVVVQSTIGKLSRKEETS